MVLSEIIVRGARQHNLKNINIEIPRNKLTVITGLSGSGKSSLAFDTIYAEGQRRYVESLSAYARQFLDQLEKPDVDSIEGLSPAISIEQKTISKSPRSTVGTVTEIYDYLRLLFFSIGQPHCHICGQRITKQSQSQIVNGILQLPEGERVMILAPVVRGRKGEFKRELEKLYKQGFLRARIDGEIRQLDEEIRLDRRKNHTIEVVVDRLLIKSDIRERLEGSVRTALKLTGGAVLVSVVDGEEKLFSEKMACLDCGVNLPDFEPRSFSFNSKYGACPKCEGLGTIMRIEPSKIIEDVTRPAEQICFLSDVDKSTTRYLRSALVAVIEKYVERLLDFDDTPKSEKEELDFEERVRELLKTPFVELPEDIQKAFFYGAEGRFVFKFGGYKYESEWKGAIQVLEDRLENPPTEKIKLALETLVTSVKCDACSGKRLRPESLAVKVAGMSIADFTSLTIEEVYEKLDELKLTERENEIAGVILKEIKERLGFLKNVGLGYLTLDRSSVTLSGGEGQRIRLAAQIGSQLRGVLYVLDEPSIGLHPKDNKKLLETLQQLRDLGNTVIVVEHDEETIEKADFVIDLGPGAGTNGGYVVAKGTPQQIKDHPFSITGQYLSGKVRIDIPRSRRKPNGKFLTVKGARARNLKNIDVEFPLGNFIVVTGVSGSGKSTLVHGILYAALAKKVYGSTVEPLEHDSVEGMEFVDKVIEIDQSPIGKTPRSNPATYTGLFTLIRNLYAMLPESRERGYKAGRFSFNVKGGRCEACEGEGVKRIEMSFLPDVYVVCDICRGKRYNHETLTVRFKGLSIADMLDTTVEDALPLLENIPQIKQKLQTLIDVGLGYIKLGQPSTTLSGGEAQRVKLAKELAKRPTGKTVYILDEPTTGLHFADIHKLLDVLQRLVDSGNTVIVIEHNLDVIKSADYIIDLGPEGGNGGGRIVAKGTPEQVAKVKKSYTGQALRAVFNKANGNLL